MTPNPNRLEPFPSGQYSEMTYPPSVVSCQRSVVGGPWSVVSVQWPATRRRPLWALTVALLLFLLPVPARAQDKDAAGQAKAREVIQAAITAMGGERYLSVKNMHAYGRLFVFDKNGNKFFTRFWDWTVFDPVLSRFQAGEGKRQEVEIYNLELRKAWKLEGKSALEEIPEEEIKNFEKSIRHNLDMLLRKRRHEEGMHLYYYGPNDISGAGEYQAVELLDATNDSVVIYFDLKTGLPARLESEVTDKMGIRHKEEVEYLNWHTLQGVHTPLRVDYHRDGSVSQQIFFEGVSYNVAIPPDHFLEPQVEKKKK